MVAARLYLPSLVTWWRLRSLVLLSALSTLSLSFSPPILPQHDFLLCHCGIKPRVLSTSLSYPFFFHHSFSSFRPSLSFFFFFYVRSDTHRRRAWEVSLSFSSISTRLIARSRTTSIKLLAVGDPLARLLPFFFICEIHSPPFPPPLPCLVAPVHTEGSALSPSSVINSVNDQIYGGQRRRQQNENWWFKLLCGFSAWHGMQAQWAIYRLTLLYLLFHKLTVAVFWCYIRSGCHLRYQRNYIF